jgi:GNAT superfamily N-acetyltransferase
MRIRRLTPDDAPHLDRILEGMSATSRYRRYHSPKPRLTSAERRYLSGADGRNHLALMAFAPDGSPIGVGRAVRLNEDPATAEMAVEVVDAWHRRGVGGELMRRIANDAAAVGIERLIAVVLTDTWLGATLERNGWRVRRTPGLTTTLALPLAERPVEVVRARAGELRHHARRHARLRPAVHQAPHGRHR